MPGRLRGADETVGEAFRIEAASVEALPEVQAMVKACGVGPHWPQEAWLGFVQPPLGEGFSRLLLLARGDDEELWGWLAASQVFERSELEYVLVDPAHRGRGVGGSLVDAWTERMRGQGLTDAVLEVRVSNERALRLYRGKHFAEQGRRSKYYEGPEEDAVLMGRKLQG